VIAIVVVLAFIVLSIWFLTKMVQFVKSIFSFDAKEDPVTGP
jgi:flagellar biosynthesis protein FliQ